MSGNDDKKLKDAEPGTDTGSEASNTIPEIEAEIVSDNSESEETGTLFDDTETANTGAPDTAEKDAEAKTAADPKSSPLKWAIPLAGIVLVAIAGGSAWYFSQTSSPDPAQPATEIVENSDTSPATEQNTIQEDNAQQNSAQQDNPESKIANAPPAEIQDENLQRATPSNQPLLSDELDLPSADEIENTALVADAKEALTPPVQDDSEDITGDAADISETENEEPETSETLTAEVAVSAPEDGSETGLQGTDDVLFETPPSTQDSETQAALAALETELEEQKNQAAALEAELATLRDEHETTRAALRSANDRNRETQQQLSQIRAENRRLQQEADRAPAVTGAVALNDISRALARGEPYEGALLTLRDAITDTQELDILGAYADGSAPSVADIQRAFKAAVRAGLSEARKAEASSVTAKYSARILNIINVRPSTPQTGASPDAIISRAEFAVENGEFTAAIAELNAMPAPAQEAMQDWVVMAQKRIAIEEALASLNTSIARDANG